MCVDETYLRACTKQAEQKEPLNQAPTCLHGGRGAQVHVPPSRAQSTAA